MTTIKFILKSIQPFKRYLLGNLLVIFFASLDTNLRPYLIKLLIDTAGKSDVNNIIIIGAAYILLQIFILSLWTFSDWCLLQYIAPLKTRIIHLLTEHINLYPYSFYQNNPSGNILAKLSDASNLIPDVITTIIYQFMQFGFSLFIALIFLAKIHYLLALCMILWISIFSIQSYLSLKGANHMIAKYSESRANIWAYMADYLVNILNVFCFSREGYEKSRLNDVCAKFIKSTKTQQHFMMRYYVVQNCFISIYTVGFLVIIIYLHRLKVITPGDLALIFLLNFRISDKLNELSSHLREFFTTWGSLVQALKIYNLNIAIYDKDDITILEPKRGAIVFNQVCFQYDKEKKLFNNLSIDIKPQQKVGVVGYSGSGKSTFVNLISRLIETDSGQIIIDGQDIKDVTRASLRKSISYIPQSPVLFHRTIKENISYGNLEATDEEIIIAAKKAHAHEFIAQLSEQYECLVGERGLKLSGGQLQRIAIARAFLKDAPILILDEATSQLDSVTESGIQKSLQESMHNKTTLVIAHRFSTLLYMDRILVFEDGKIIQDGNHSDLLKQKGLYAALWDAQVNGLLPRHFKN